MIAMVHDKQERIVVSFATTFDAMEAERLCHESQVPGRIIPLPVEIDSECGLAWAMPSEEGVLAMFNAAVGGHLLPEGIHRIML